MKNWEWEWAAFTLLAAVTCFAIGAALGCAVTREKAIKAGAAEYVHNPTQQSGTFTWKGGGQ